jgi:regulator of PEP synthase PpsR (kinase-PPPase family)
MSKPNLPTIYLVSDGTGRTCETVVQSVLVQFQDEKVRLVRKAGVRRPTDITELMEQAAGERAVVFYTLVYDKARQAMRDAARERMVPAVDLLEPLLISLYDLFQTNRRAKPGILYKSNRAYYDRIDAVEYTLNHDDGCRIHELGQADVVLVGLSRSSKSTTCFYLAYSGIRAANVPLVRGQTPPPELLQLDQRRVLVLTVNPYRLQAVREARLKTWDMDPNSDYADKSQIAFEIRSLNELINKYGWNSLDVSYKAVEEIAREVIRLLNEAGVKTERRA